MRTIMRVAGYLVYAAVSLLVCMMAAEVYLRNDDDTYLRLYYWNYDPPMYAPREDIPYTLRPNVDGIHFRRGEFSVHVHTNTQALREDREIAIPKPPDTYRILVIGDSFAFGYGVERRETFEAVAERALQAKHSSRKVEVVNMGFAAAGSLDARYLYLREEALRFEPDAIVVVLFYGADLGRLVENRPYSDYGEDGLPIAVHFEPITIDPDTGVRVSRYDFETEKAAHVLFPSLFPRKTFDETLKPSNITDIFAGIWILATDFKPVPLCTTLRLCRVVYKYVEVWRLTDRNTGVYAANLFLPPEPQPVGDLLLDHPGQDADGLPRGAPGNPSVAADGWRLAKQIFSGMKEVVDARRLQFGVLFVPSPVLVDYDPKKGKTDKLAKFFLTEEMEAAQKLDKPDRLFGGWLKNAGIAYLDPAHGMRADREREDRKFYFEFDQHWNAAGHASLGRHVAEWIEGQGWLASATTNTAP